MSVICPAILAKDSEEYSSEMKKIGDFAHRIQIDLTDGEFAKSQTINPDQVWWPVGMSADLHLMYKHPLPAVKQILEHEPHLVIVHAEAAADFDEVAALCRKHWIKIGLALLPYTSPESIQDRLEALDHVLIFSGDLGHYGGQADLKLLSKVEFLKGKKPSLEIGWDGGVNDQNVAELVNGGVDVLNVGGYLQHADNPRRTYSALSRIADETGTT